MVVKTLYMSKESYALLHSAEKGLNIDWGLLLYEKLQFYAGLRDKRRKVSVDIFTPYMVGLFSHWNAIHGKVLVVDEGDDVEGPKGGDGRKRKLQYTVGPSSAQSNVADIKSVRYMKEEEAD